MTAHELAIADRYLRPWTRRQQLIIGLLAATWWQIAGMAWDVIRWKLGA